MSEVLFYGAAFALLIGVLIIVHELGHYLVARLAGVKVLRFSVGFGRPILLRRWGQDGTEWALGAFPLGGYVRMLDETEGEVLPEEAHRSFNRQSLGKRMAIVAAGPLANFMLAIVVYWGLFMHGAEELRPLLGHPVVQSPAAQAGIVNGERVRAVDGDPVQTWGELRWALLQRVVEQDEAVLEVLNERGDISFRRLMLADARDVAAGGADPVEKLGLTFYQPAIPPVVGRTMPGEAGEQAGLRHGDRITAINDRPVTVWQDIVDAVSAAPGESLNFSLQRDGVAEQLRVTPAFVTKGGRTFGRIGVAPQESGRAREALFVTVRYGVFSALGKAVEETSEKSLFSLRMMGKMLTGGLSWRHLSGPVAIADYAGQSAKLGLEHYLRFLALVSISLAVLNLLPVPVLDGGHLLYYVAEFVRGKPLSDAWAAAGQKIGLVLILTLMAFALYNDLSRLIPG